MQFFFHSPTTLSPLMLKSVSPFQMLLNSPLYMLINTLNSVCADTLTSSTQVSPWVHRCDIVFLRKSPSLKQTNKVHTHKQEPTPHLTLPAAHAND